MKFFPLSSGMGRGFFPASKGWRGDFFSQESDRERNHCHFDNRGGDGNNE